MNYMSKAEDVEFLAHELVKVLGDKISINRFSLGQEVLSGKYLKDTEKFIKFNGIDFNIKYSTGEFLRINVGETDLLKPYSEKFKTIVELKNAIANISLNEEERIGDPLAFYYIEESGHYIPYYEWAFVKQEEYISELENNMLFDDGTIIEGLTIFNKKESTDEKRLLKN